MSEGLSAVQIVTTLIGGGGFLTGAAALWHARVSDRSGVSGDEREARRDEAAQKRDTIADRDAQIDQLQEDVGAMRAEVARATERSERSTERADRLLAELEAEREYSRILIDHIYRGAPPPPPPRPIRTA